MRTETNRGGWGWRALFLAIALGFASPSLLADDPGSPGGPTTTLDDDRPVGSLPIVQSGSRGGPGARGALDVPARRGKLAPTWGPWRRPTVAFPTEGGDVVVLSRSGEILLGPVWVPAGIVTIELPASPALVLLRGEDGTVEVVAGTGF